jgi:serine/threonine protein kinase
MGNCHQSLFVQEEDDTRIPKTLSDDFGVKNAREGNKDALIEFIEQTVNSFYLKDISHFKNIYKIKKNLNSFKDIFYRIKVIQNTLTGRLSNMKMIKKSEIEKIGFDKFKKLFASEMKVLQNSKITFIESLINVYIDSSIDDINIYVVTNYTAKYSLLDVINEQIKKKRRFSDKDVALIIKFLTEKLYSFKSEGMIYRNFSPENIFFEKERDFRTLCLRNFYFSTFPDSSNKTRGVTGALWFMAPEMLVDSFYDTKVDVWSCGVTLYMLLTLENPFVEYRSLNEMAEAINLNKCFKNVSEWKKYSLNLGAINFTYDMIKEDKDFRISPENMVEKKYFKENMPQMDKHELIKIIKHDDSKVFEKLKFKIKNLRSMHNIIYYLFLNLKQNFIDIEEIILFNNFFNHLDDNKDGSVRKSEIEDILSNDEAILGKTNIINYIEIIEVLVDNDLRIADPSNIIFIKDSYSFEHFLIANLILRMFLNKDQDWVKKRIKNMFNELDADGSSFISLKEIQQLFNHNENKEYMRDNLKFILADSSYDPDIIKDLNKMSLSDIENFLFYECVKLSYDQQNCFKDKEK